MEPNDSNKEKEIETLPVEADPVRQLSTTIDNTKSYKE